MACDRATLLSQAQANGFDRQATVISNYRALVIQLGTNASGSPQDLDQLWTQAEANGFLGIARNQQQFFRTALQLICDATP